MSDSNPLDSFTTLSDWRFETYNSDLGITDPEQIAYVVRMSNLGWSSPFQNRSVDDLSQFEALLRDPRVVELKEFRRF